MTNIKQHDKEMAKLMTADRYLELRAGTTNSTTASNGGGGGAGDVDSTTASDGNGDCGVGGEGDGGTGNGGSGVGGSGGVGVEEVGSTVGNGVVGGGDMSTGSGTMGSDDASIVSGTDAPLKSPKPDEMYTASSAVCQSTPAQPEQSQSNDREDSGIPEKIRRIEEL